ncbi:outer membrane beta-barrel protein [Aquimarina agarivorans]|uniref:outer membrane beta-barrel protein n=1 Tax=Aquimarina agarivorans TaxID=980584 RepID=UPI000248F29B|nr:outer membrane beta-barrel protein [Aquimarina agarivorans]
MKKILLLLFIVVFNLNYNYAQEKGKLRVGLDFGYASLNEEDDGGGFVFYFETKYNISKQMNVGVRYGGAFLAKATENVTNQTSGRLRFFDVGINSSILGTFDYYFNKGNSSFAPFIGGGIGAGFVTNTAIDVKIFDSDEDEDDSENNIDGETTISGMLRAGVEWSKFRLSLDYNLTPDTALENLTEKRIGTSKNSYLGITIGFYLGGGKWKTNS